MNLDTSFIQFLLDRAAKDFLSGAEHNQRSSFITSILNYEAVAASIQAAGNEYLKIRGLTIRVYFSHSGFNIIMEKSQKA